MTHVRRLRQAGIFLATGGLVLTYSLNRHWLSAWAFVALGWVWWYGGRHAWGLASSVGMTGFILGAIAGVWLGVSPVSMLVVTASALAVWDLSYLEQRLRLEEQDPSIQRLSSRHLRKLFVVMVAGVFVAGIGMSLQVKVNFWIVVFLGLMLAFTLSRAFLSIRIESNT